MQRGRKISLGADRMFLTMSPAAIFAAYRRAGLPFIPFDIFDRQARVLPGTDPARGESALFVAEEFRSDQGWESMQNSPG
jgi:hypothetical protein